MSENLELLEQLKKLLSYKKSKAFYAEKLGVSEEEVTELLAELRGKPLKIKELEEELDEEIQRFIDAGDVMIEVNLEKGTLKSSAISDFEPKSPEELAMLHRVDLSKYKISSYWTKQRGEKFTSSLLCTLLKPTELNPEHFAEFLKGYKSSYLPSSDSTREPKIKEVVDVEISLADFHIDKLDLSGEIISDRKKQYKAILENLLSKVVLPYHINKVVFTIGNDFFQTDSYNNTTTKGTPVDYSTSWSNAYEEGFDLMVWAISHIRSFCSEMEVILVAGNHDRTKAYYLAHALEAFFQNDKNVSFQRHESPLKYTMIGNTFVGYHHGDCKIDDLPLIFATSPQSSAAFGGALYREVRTGDKHYYLTKEIKGVRIQQLPSLAGTDRWHRDSLFVNNIRAGLILIYSPTEGKIGEFESRIKPII